MFLRYMLSAEEIDHYISVLSYDVGLSENPAS